MEIYHIEPLRDLKPHTTSGEHCACKPSIEQLPDRRLIIHHSYDGREFFEDMCNELRNKEEGH